MDEIAWSGARSSRQGSDISESAFNTLRILLTGAAGFIGSHLTERFLASAHSVIAVDNLSTGRVANLASFRDHPRFTFVKHDVVEPIEIDCQLDWVMHFASPASPPKYL